MKVHSTSLVDKKALIDVDVEIGPFCTVGANVKIAAGTKLISHVVIDGRTTLGKNNTLYPGVVLGMPAQDKKFDNKNTYLEIGDDNLLREHVTMHTGNLHDTKTVVGSRNFFMVGVHIGHNCIVGNDIVMANGVGLSGFTTIEDQVTIGGFVGVHQFNRVGRMAMVGGLSKITTDVPPFSLVDGNPCFLRGSNIVGLKRAGIKSSEAMAIKEALKILFRSGSVLSQAIAITEKKYPNNPHVQEIINFCKNSKRPIVRGQSRKSTSQGDDGPGEI